MAKVNELDIVNPSDLPRAESIEGVTLPLVQDGKMVVASAADFLEECKKLVNKFIAEKGEELSNAMAAIKDGKSAYQVWLEQGNHGSEADFFQAIKGEKGDAFKYEDFTPQQLAKLKGVKGDNGKDGRIALVNHGTNETTFSLTPNTMHIWGEVEKLTLSCASNPEQDILAEYCFQFTSPGTKATTLILTGVKWYDDIVPPVFPGKTYQASIVNGVIIMIEA